MLNCPRVTCSSSASMFACCSKRKLVTRAMTPVLSRPMTVTVAYCFMQFRIFSRRHFEFPAHGLSNFPWRAGAFRCVAPAELRRIGILLDQSLPLRRGVNVHGEPLRQVDFHLVK